MHSVVSSPRCVCLCVKLASFMSDKPLDINVLPTRSGIGDGPNAMRIVCGTDDHGFCSGRAGGGPMHVA
jgi:hypothetical protein